MAISLIDVAKHYAGLPHQDVALAYLQDLLTPQELANFAEIWRKPIGWQVGLGNLYYSTLYAPQEVLAQYLPAINEGFAKLSFSRAEGIHFLAQLLHESGEFRFTEELADGSAYEGRVDLGNTQPGDGKRFKGRGLIQLTGRANYERFSKAMDEDYVAKPELVAQLPASVQSAFWFWTTNNLSAIVKRYGLNEFGLQMVTRLINGGLNGLAERRVYFNRLQENCK